MGKIEVTQEMINSAIAELMQWDSRIEWDRSLVICIYEAMERVRRAKGSAALAPEARAEFLRKLHQLGGEELDSEYAHEAADDILCDVLRAVGLGDVVDAWERVQKNYT